MIYLFVIILLLCLSLRYDINERTKYRNEWYYVMLVIFILIAGIRYRIGVDTLGYINTYYHRIPLLSDFWENEYSYAQYPLWKLINSSFYTFGAPFYSVQLFTATFVNGLIFVYIRKHSDYIFTCLFFYFVCYYFSLNCETMKASYAIVICLFANDCFLEKKRLKGFALLFVAVLFHPSTIVFIVVPLLLFLRLNLLGIVILLITFVGGYVVQKSLGDYLLLFDVLENDAIANKLETYTESDKYGDGMGLTSIVKRTLPILFFSIISVKCAVKNKCNEKLLALEPLLTLALIFLIFQIHIIFFYRFYEFLFIYVCLFWSQLFVDIAKSSKYQRLFSYARALLLFSPLLLSIALKYGNSYMRYYPYASVIDKSIDKDREKEFNNLRNGETSRFDEY